LVRWVRIGCAHHPPFLPCLVHILLSQFYKQRASSVTPPPAMPPHLPAIRHAHAPCGNVQCAVAPCVCCAPRTDRIPALAPHRETERQRVDVLQHFRPVHEGGDPAGRVEARGRAGAAERVVWVVSQSRCAPAADRSPLAIVDKCVPVPAWLPACLHACLPACLPAPALALYVYPGSLRT
jgi:hypothetical protein